jgi:signal recognition particle receptor subunit beta
VLVVDAKDKQKIGEAAEYLFDVIQDVDIATSSVKVIVACNKSDLGFARRAVQIERDLQTEIEQIRKVRKASRE